MGELRQLVTEAARDALEEIRAAAGGETLYGFALFATPDATHVVPSANTEEGLLRAAERYLANGYGSLESLTAHTAVSLRWNVPDWAFHCVGEEHFADANALLASEENEEDGADDRFAELVGALRDLDREQAFGWGPERDAVVVLIATGDRELGEILELARDLNPAAPFARLQRALG